MSHPTLVELSMAADGALSGAEAAALEAHAGQCEVCRAQLASLRQTSEQLHAAMQLEVQADIPIPRFSRPVSLRNFALANVATGLAIWLGQFLWKTLFGEMVVNAASWFTSIYLPDIYAVSSAAVLYLLEEGTAMLDAYLGLIVVSVLGFTALVLWLKRQQRASQLSVGLCLVILGIAAAPTPAHALEVRKDDDAIIIEASETIDDTLVVAAESVVIKGTVTGSVIAVGQAVDIDGSVGGNVVSFAESVKIRGKVAGSIISAASALNLAATEVAGDVWLAGESVTVDDDTTIGGNATIAGESVTVDGRVTRDLWAFSESVELNGQVDGNFEAFAGRVRLLGDARVGGNLRLRTEDEDRLYQAQSAEVAGEIEFLEMPEDLGSDNEYLQPEFYLWQLAQLIGAFLVGWVLLSYVPGLRRLSIGAGMDGVKSAGIGLLALVSTPIAAVLIAATLIGLPVGIILLGLWLLGLYLTQIVVGATVGRMVMPDNDSLPQTLFVGLLIVTVVVNLPFIGGIIGFVLLILGLGLLLEYVYAATRRADPAL